MNPAGLTDSLAGIDLAPNECPRCHATARVLHGICLGCLLRSGVRALEEEDGPDEFDAALAAIPVADTHWRIGNYEVLEEIGRGGMGVIYRARQRHSRRIVALKRVLSYHADSRETLARFRREAEAAASLDHPNILPIYEVGESDDGVPYFSMKYASGGSLLEVGPALRHDSRQIVRLMAKVTRAVQYAHREGILHRDLKPGNILLDGRGEPLVSDFGLAKWLDASSDLTRSLTVFGTPGYIAPEQAQGPAANLTPSADVYSLGAILFDLLSGRPPFLGEHALAVIHQAAQKEAPRLRSLVTGANKDIETICARCLERDPAARYHSAGDLAEDLERWLEGRSIVARPVLPPLRAWRWARRNPVLAAAAVTALLLSGAVIVAQVERARLARTVDAATIYQRSIAVVPFLDLDTVTNNLEFARSFVAAIQPKLTQFGPARVTTIADNSWPGAGTANAIRGLTSQAGTRTLLMGTMRRVNGKLSVSLHLVDGNSSETLLQRRVLFEDVADSPTRLSALAAAELSAILNGDQSSRGRKADPALQNQTAHEYIRAAMELEKHATVADFDRAIVCCRKAIETSPSSALAKAQFVLEVVNRAQLEHPDSALIAEAERLGREAVQLNPNLGQTHRALASMYFLEGELRNVLAQELDALELTGPEERAALAAGAVAKIIGRPDTALKWYAIAKHRQEGPADDESTIGDCWADLGDDRRAEAVYNRYQALHPELPEGWGGLCRLRLLNGNFESARAICRANAKFYPDFPFTDEITAESEFFARNWPEAHRLYSKLARTDPSGGGSFYGAVSYQSALGRLRQILGDQGADKTLQDCLAAEKAALRIGPDHPETLYRMAAIESSLGDINSSLVHLEAAFQNGWIDYRSLSLDPRFDRIRQDARYGRISWAMATRVESLRRSQSTDEIDWKNSRRK
jgi:tetratricopeptide (TPR) repeat protein/tRNA A-37 threonylcarbamoyl transferase component Bud32